MGCRTETLYRKNCMVRNSKSGINYKRTKILNYTVHMAEDLSVLYLSTFHYTKILNYYKRTNQYNQHQFVTFQSVFTVQSLGQIPGACACADSVLRSESQNRTEIDTRKGTRGISVSDNNIRYIMATPSIKFPFDNSHQCIPTKW
jgi:hypothetical protein